MHVFQRDNTLWQLTQILGPYLGLWEWPGVKTMATGRLTSEPRPISFSTQMKNIQRVASSITHAILKAIRAQVGLESGTKTRECSEMGVLSLLL